MDEWMKVPVSQLKKLVKSRAGRIAELQMEVKILEGIIEKKVSEGDLGGSVTRVAEKKAAPVEKGLEEKEAPQQIQETNDSKIKDESSSHAFKEIE